VADIDPIAQLAGRECGRAALPVRLGHHCLDVGQHLAALGGGIAGMHRPVADDARGAGNEEDFLAGRIGQRGAREGRAARAIVGGVVIGTNLARVLQRRRRLPAGHEGDAQRPAGEADGAGGRHVAGGPALEFEEGILAADVELAITFEAVRLAVDVGEVVPYSPQVRQAFGGEQPEDASISFLAGGLQG